MSIGKWSEFHTPYNDTVIDDYVPTKPGIYTLWVRSNTGRWDCIYVGNADNLQYCLLSHLKPEETSTCLKESRHYPRGFMWIEITAEHERFGAEKYIYDCFHPECNLYDPRGQPLIIPLPPTPTTT